MSDHKKPQLKPGLNFAESKNKRVQTTLTLRKKKRQENLLKRRRENDSMSLNGDGIALTPVVDEHYDLKTCVKWVSDVDSEVRFKGVLGIRKLLSDSNPPIQEVIELKLVPYFISSLGSPHLGIVFESCWILTNIATGDKDQTETIITNNGVLPLINLINHHVPEIQEQALWTLGNIAGEYALYRDYINEHGIVESIVRAVMETQEKRMLYTSSWVIANLCRGKPEPNWDLLSPLLSVIPKLISNEEVRTVSDACWTLCFFTDSDIPNSNNIRQVIESGVCFQLVEQLSSPSFSVQSPALRTVGNIICGTNEEAGVILRFNALDRIRLLLMSAKKHIKKDACWVVSNVAAGPATHIDALIEANIFPELIKLLRNDDNDIKREAVWAISNAASGTNIQKQYLISIGCVEALGGELQTPDINTVRVSLEGIVRLLKYDSDMNENNVKLKLESCEAISIIENMQNNSLNSEIYSRCEHILSQLGDMTEEEGLPEGFKSFKLPGRNNSQFHF